MHLDHSSYMWYQSRSNRFRVFLCCFLFRRAIGSNVIHVLVAGTPEQWRRFLSFELFPFYLFFHVTIHFMCWFNESARNNFCLLNMWVECVCTNCTHSTITLTTYPFVYTWYTDYECVNGVFNRASYYRYYHVRVRFHQTFVKFLFFSVDLVFVAVTSHIIVEVLSDKIKWKMARKTKNKAQYIGIKTLLYSDQIMYKLSRKIHTTVWDRSLSWYQSLSWDRYICHYMELKEKQKNTLSLLEQRRLFSPVYSIRPAQTKKEEEKMHQKQLDKKKEDLFWVIVDRDWNLSEMIYLIVLSSPKSENLCHRHRSSRDSSHHVA